MDKLLDKFNNNIVKVDKDKDTKFREHADLVFERVREFNKRIEDSKVKNSYEEYVKRNTPFDI